MSNYREIFGDQIMPDAFHEAVPVSQQKYVPPHLRNTQALRCRMPSSASTQPGISRLEGDERSGGAGGGSDKGAERGELKCASVNREQVEDWRGGSGWGDSKGAGNKGGGRWESSDSWSTGRTFSSASTQPGTSPHPVDGRREIERGGDRWGWGSFDKGRIISREEREVKALFESSRLNAGINFDDYFNIPVHVQGKKGAVLPPPVDTFEKCTRLGSHILSNIEHAGYKKPTPIQEHALPIVLEGFDLMGCAQTGSGKTGAFLFPMITSILRAPEPTRRTRCSAPRGLVLAPTRELVQQIFTEARKFSYKTGLMPAVAYGGSENRREQVHRVEQGADIVIATPGRLLDFFECGKIYFHATIFLVLDEADRMLDMGFEPQIRTLVEQSDMPHKHNRHTLMFSATFPKQIQALAQDFLKEDFVSLMVGKVGSASANTTQKCLFARSNNEKPGLLIDLLSAEELECTKVLIFVETKRGADLLEALLQNNGFMSTSIHGDRTQKERETALASFRAGHEPILVATDVAARGLDIPNVTQVVNYDMPQSIDDYVHRIGRTGRAGNPGNATVFLTDRDGGRLAKDLIDVLAEARQEIPLWLEQLAQSYPTGSSSWGGGGWGGQRGGGGRKGGSRWGSSFGRNGGGFGGTYASNTVSFQ